MARFHSIHSFRNMAFFSKCNFSLALFLFLFVLPCLLPSVHLFFGIQGKFALKGHYLTEDFPIIGVELQI